MTAFSRRETACICFGVAFMSSIIYIVPVRYDATLDNAAQTMQTIYAVSVLIGLILLILGFHWHTNSIKEEGRRLRQMKAQNNDDSVPED